MAETRPGVTRINLDMPDELYARWSHAFEHGIRSQVHRRLIALACDAVETSGSLMIGAILTGELTLVYAPPEERHNVTDPTNVEDLDDAQNR